MNCAQREKPGPDGPGPHREPPESLDATVVPDPSHPICGAGCKHHTTASGVRSASVDPIHAAKNRHSGPDCPGRGPAWFQGVAPAPDGSPAVISAREWVHEGFAVSLTVLGVLDAGARRAWVDRTLAEALFRRSRARQVDDSADPASGSNWDLPGDSDSPCSAGGREPVRPGSPHLSTGHADPLPIDPAGGTRPAGGAS